MEILVTRGVVVDAESIEEALEKTKPAVGVTVTINAVPRPPSSVAPGSIMVPVALQKAVERASKR